MYPRPERSLTMLLSYLGLETNKSEPSRPLVVGVVDVIFILVRTQTVELQESGSVATVIFFLPIFNVLYFQEVVAHFM